MGCCIAKDTIESDDTTNTSNKVNRINTSIVSKDGRPYLQNPKQASFKSDHTTKSSLNILSEQLTILKFLQNTNSPES